LPREQRFEEFYDAVFGRLVGQLFLVTGDLHDAEDAVQEALTRAAARWARLRGSTRCRRPGSGGWP
jgi:RNA polymerase sigma-70 factor, ECF subfamily